MAIKNCIECNIECKLDRILKLYLCCECVLLDIYTVISKTSVESSYFLKDEDLIDLKNYNSRGIIYYMKNDIVDRCCMKYNINMNSLSLFLHNMKEEKEEKRLMRKTKKNIITLERRSRLKDALSKVGLTYRRESMLCDKYLEGQINSVEEVVEKMCHVKFLQEYCNINECRREAFILSKKEDLDCSVSEYAEIIALNKYSNGKYPDVYPWQNNINII
jgi:hypothetical protein